jgi:hypothetical protein
MPESVQKTPFAMRIYPILLKLIDAIRPGAGFHSRTELIETALAAYVEYLEENNFSSVTLYKFT